MFTRRGFLAGGLAAALFLAAREAFAIGPAGAGTSGPRPGALRRLAREVEKRTSIDVEDEPVLVAPTKAVAAPARPGWQSVWVQRGAAAPVAVPVRRQVAGPGQAA